MFDAYGFIEWSRRVTNFSCDTGQRNCLNADRVFARMVVRY